jgi:hypothetical protein
MATKIKITHHRPHINANNVVLCGDFTAEITENAIGDDHRISLGEIDIAMNDGTYGRFHLYARIKRGRPILEVSTNSADGSRSIVKQSTASKIKRS